MGAVRLTIVLVYPKGNLKESHTNIYWVILLAATHSVALFDKRINIPQVEYRNTGVVRLFQYRLIVCVDDERSSSTVAIYMQVVRPDGKWLHPTNVYSLRSLFLWAR